MASKPDELWQRADEHDFVVIAAPNDAHAPLAERAVDAGLAVVVDKPLAPSAAQAADSSSTRARTELLTVFQNRRWDSDQRTLRRLLAEARWATSCGYESRFERWRPEPRADAWRETAGRRRAGASCSTSEVTSSIRHCTSSGRRSGLRRGRQPPRRRPATTTPSWRCDTAPAIHSHLWMSAVAAAPGPRLRVLGRAPPTCRRGRRQEDALRSGRRPDDPARGGRAGVAWGGSCGATRASRFRASRARGRVLHGVRARAASGGPPPVDPADAVATLEVIDAARRSAAEGKITEP